MSLRRLPRAKNARAVPIRPWALSAISSPHHLLEDQGGERVPALGFLKAGGEAILPAGCAARAMGGEKPRNLHISGETVAIDEMMLNSSSSSAFKFTRQGYLAHKKHPPP